MTADPSSNLRITINIGSTQICYCGMYRMYRWWKIEASKFAYTEQPLSKQSIHRLSVRIWKAEEELFLLFEYRMKVSHLCHQKICFNPQHLIVESHLNNTRRNDCAGVRVDDHVAAKILLSSLAPKTINRRFIHTSLDEKKPCKKRGNK